MSNKQASITVVVVAYNMEREIPRTLTTLLPPYQKGIALSDVNIIVVDNGSTNPLTLNDMPENVSLITINDPISSPAQALNLGVEAATTDLVTLWIDGARMASPNLISMSLLASKLNDRVIVSTLGFHLGAKAQQFSQQQGYSQDVEDALLSSLDWQSNGYRLFEISSFGGSCKNGWFSAISESNAITMSKTVFSELGGLDERFVKAGGGLVNLDFFQRAVVLPNCQQVCLLGEGTFHQYHGGAATNQPNHTEVWEDNLAEYQQIFGEPFICPDTIDWLYVGKVPKELYPSLRFLINEWEVNDVK
ncbi:glycosyltransferase family A protein [Shewanella waksmanii]|uniref:glycosyltransferase family A protein n=1 Tax=Shewanella waksmanii TaxID=213783 RepID=UPI0037366A66